MIKIDDEYYYIDLDALSTQLEKDDTLKEGTITETDTVTQYDADDVQISKEVTVSSRHKPKEVDAFKYQLIAQMIEILLHTELEFSQSKMKASISQAPANYIVAFNTLLKLNVLKKI